MKKKKTVKGNQSRPEVINFVCKYDLKFNHARVYDDRKRKIPFFALFCVTMGTVSNPQL